MSLRRSCPEDTAAIAQLFTETVHAVNARDYSPEQLAAWAPRPPNLAWWLGRLSEAVVFVAEAESQIVGFAAFTSEGHLDLLYTHPRFLRRGVAAALLQRIEAQARSLQVGQLFAEVSLTARPFFEQAAFRVVASQTVERHGVAFVNYRMEKLL